MAISLTMFTLCKRTYAGLVMKGGTSTSKSIVIACDTSSFNDFNFLRRFPTKGRTGKAVHPICGNRAGGCRNRVPRTSRACGIVNGVGRFRIAMARAAFKKHPRLISAANVLSCADLVCVTLRHDGATERTVRIVASLVRRCKCGDSKRDFAVTSGGRT